MSSRIHKFRVRRAGHAADVNLLNIRALVLKALALNEITKGGGRDKEEKESKE